MDAKICQASKGRRQWSSWARSECCSSCERQRVEVANIWTSPGHCPLDRAHLREAQRGHCKRWLPLEARSRQRDAAVTVSRIYPTRMSPRGSHIPEGNQQRTLTLTGQRFPCPHPSMRFILPLPQEHTGNHTRVLFRPSAQHPTLCLAPGVLGKWLGGKAPARPGPGSPGFPSKLAEARAHTHTSVSGGRPPASNCTVLQ